MKLEIKHQSIIMNVRRADDLIRIALEFLIITIQKDKHYVENKFTDILNSVLAKYEYQKEKEKETKLKKYKILKSELGL